MARGLSLPAADEIPPTEAAEQYGLQQEKSSTDSKDLDFSEQALHNLTIPLAPRGQAQSSNSESSVNLNIPVHSGQSLTGPNAGSTLLRGRTKTLASLGNSSKNASQAELQPKEIQLPKGPSVNGQPIEAYLYKDASECPICFLYYPPFLNKTRCCEQAICSECFVQIKRPDPHAPEHADPSAPLSSQPDVPTDPDTQLVSEPAACPFCVQPEFGVSYDPPSFRRGLAYAAGAPPPPLGKMETATSSSTSLPSTVGSGDTIAGRRRATSLAVNDATVITTDKVRPDWAAKLASARAHAARRSAAATALHTAAYLMGGRNGGSESRFGFGRRGMLRRGTGSDSPSDGGSSSHLQVLAMMAERHRNAEIGDEPVRADSQSQQGSPSMIGPPRHSSRRNRIDDLEEMMMMEAIRLSLAAEEDRRKKEEKQAEKDAKKDAKKRAKEEKKAEKAAKKNGPYPPNNNQSSQTLDNGQGTVPGKGKAAARKGAYPSDIDIGSAVPPTSAGESAQSYLEKSRAILKSDSPNSPNFPSAPVRPSHLRTLSNASSNVSSINEPLSPFAGSISSLEPSPNASSIHIVHGTISDNGGSATPPGGDASMEPMFNFRSLAAVIDQEEKGLSSPLIEHTEQMDHNYGAETGLDSTEASSSTKHSSYSDTLSESVATLKPSEEIPAQPGNANTDKEKFAYENHTVASMLQG